MFLYRSPGATIRGSSHIKALWAVSIALPVVRFGLRPKDFVMHVQDALHWMLLSLILFFRIYITFSLSLSLVCPIYY